MSQSLSVRVLASTGLLVTAIVAGCDRDAEQKTFAAPGMINVETGSYRGVALGDPISRAHAVFGPKEAVHDELVAPADETVESYYGAPVGGVRGPGPSVQDFIYRHDGVVFLVFEGKIEEIGVGDEGATTERGVRIGDRLEKAKAAYPELTCGTANEGSDYPEYPGCTGKVGSRFVWFGGDPIETIELGSARFFL